jgi:hypothetical protein
VKYDVSDLKAVYGNSGVGRIIHLRLPGFRPGAKSRTMSDAALCGAADTHSGRTTEIDFDRALTLERAIPVDDDPRPTPPPIRRWCPRCVGHALAVFDLIDVALTLITTEIPSKGTPA